MVFEIKWVNKKVGNVKFNLVFFLYKKVLIFIKSICFLWGVNRFDSVCMDSKIFFYFIGFGNVVCGVEIKFKKVGRIYRNIYI